MIKININHAHKSPVKGKLYILLILSALFLIITLIAIFSLLIAIPLFLFLILPFILISITKKLGSLFYKQKKEWKDIKIEPKEPIVDVKYKIVK